MEVRTRFAPSPTGYLHIGGARTALFSWLYARKHHGKFILRIEDTDQERSSDEFVKNIISALQWLGLDYDEGPYFQSKRINRYKEFINALLDQDKAYYCYCTKSELEAVREEQLKNKQKPRYNGRCRDSKDTFRSDIQPVVRFKNPLHGDVIVNDLVKGKVVFSNTELDDLILLRSDGTPTYNLTVVVDDLDMAITHVIRGEDHLNNTPRQINLIQAFGKMPPAYAHVPLILGSDGKRLSKRHGAVSVTQYQEDGFLPHALLNYLVRLGWAYGDQEIFSIAQLINSFDIKDINQSAAAFNMEKLLWLNHHYIKENNGKDQEIQLKSQLNKYGVTSSHNVNLMQLYEIQKERCKTLKEMAENSLYFFQEPVKYDAVAVKKHFKNDTPAILLAIKQKFIQESKWEASAIHNLIEQVSVDFGVKMGNVAQPLRVAVTGGSVSPPIDATLALLGRERVLKRLDLALDVCQASA